MHWSTEIPKSGQHRRGASHQKDTARVILRQHQIMTAKAPSITVLVWQIFRLVVLLCQRSMTTIHLDRRPNPNLLSNLLRLILRPRKPLLVQVSWSVQGRSQHLIMNTLRSTGIPSPPTYTALPTDQSYVKMYLWSLSRLSIRLIDSKLVILSTFMLTPPLYQRKSQSTHCWIATPQALATSLIFTLTPPLYQRKTQSTHCWIATPQALATSLIFTLTPPLYQRKTQSTHCWIATPQALATSLIFTLTPTQ
ncbi:hypothetical protein PENNAL_c0687G00180, partial [Penicillium nalgiovense]